MLILFGDKIRSQTKPFYIYFNWLALKILYMSYCWSLVYSCWQGPGDDDFQSFCLRGSIFRLIMNTDSVQREHHFPDQ